MNPSAQKSTANISKQIFEKFLIEIKKIGISNDIIERLSDNYKKGGLTETEVRKALYPDESEK